MKTLRMQWFDHTWLNKRYVYNGVAGHVCSNKRVCNIWWIILPQNNVFVTFGEPCVLKPLYTKRLVWICVMSFQCFDVFACLHVFPCLQKVFVFAVFLFSKFGTGHVANDYCSKANDIFASKCRSLRQNVTTSIKISRTPPNIMCRAGAPQQALTTTYCILS